MPLPLWEAIPPYPITEEALLVAFYEGRLLIGFKEEPHARRALPIKKEAI